MSTEIQPCPRCGGEIRVEEGVYGEVWEWHCVKCLVMSGYRFATKAKAIADANRRVPSEWQVKAEFAASEMRAMKTHYENRYDEILRHSVQFWHRLRRMHRVLARTLGHQLWHDERTHKGPRLKPSRTEAEAVWLLRRLLHPGNAAAYRDTRKWLLKQKLAVRIGGVPVPSDAAFRARYGEVDGDTSKPSTE